MERGNDKTALPVKLLDMVEKTCRTGGLHGEPDIVSRYTPECKTPVLLDKNVYFIAITCFVECHFFFNILLTTRTEDTSLSVEVNTSTFQTWEERPL